MEKNIPKIDAMLAFLEAKSKTAKKDKTKEMYEGCIYFIKRHKMVYYGNREGELLLLHVRKKYTATLSKTQTGMFRVCFRHPVVADNSGRSGKSISRSLETRNKRTANKYVKELQELISDDYWWPLDRKSEALGVFSKVPVEIFYKYIEDVVKLNK